MNWRFRFTVFTPTYNRAHTLPRVYDSLCAQTFRDFEWLVVDDGSTDNTESLVTQWAKRSPFPINYVKQSNGGKHVAFNTATKVAQGELFLNLDSDDACVPEALERFLWHWQQIPNRERFTGVTCLCKDQAGNIVGDRFPKDVFDSDSLEIAHRYGVRGEKWGFHRTDVIQRFPFPAASPKTIVGEGIIWARIAREYRTRFVNEALRIYFQDPQGRLTTRSLKDRASSTPFYLMYIRENLDWLVRSPRNFFAAVANFNRLNLHGGQFAHGLLKCVREESRGVGLAVLSGVLPGLVMYARDRARGVE